MTANPFTIEIYDKARAFQCFIGDPINVVATPRHNQKPTASITVTSDHQRLDALTASGARCILRYYGEFLMSGKLNLRQGQGPTQDGTVTFFLDGDFRILDNVLGWAVPGNAITSQTTAEQYKVTGNAETIVKDLVTKNAIDRLAYPGLTVATNQNRGDVISGGVAVRFSPLRDVLLPAVETAGLGISFQQQGSSIVCDVYQPGSYPQKLSEAGGMIVNWSWSDADPSATRVVVGGSGDGTARMFRQTIDTTLESEYGDIIEVFRDARDADSITVMDARAAETLTDGKPKFGFALTLAETATFRYGGAGVHVGDTVSVDIGFATRTDILREVTLSWTQADGIGVTPVVGNLSDNPDKTLGAFLRKLRKGLTDLKVSK